jgi:hypothetical protein
MPGTSKEEADELAAERNLLRELHPRGPYPCTASSFQWPADEDFCDVMLPFYVESGEITAGRSRTSRWCCSRTPCKRRSPTPTGAAEGALGFAVR